MKTKAATKPTKLTKKSAAMPRRRTKKLDVPAVKTGRVQTKVPNKANTPKHDKTPKPLPQNEAKILVGPYGTKAQAEQEAAQFMHPDVFSYRSALFPNPTNYGIKVTMISAEPVEAQNANPLNPYKVELHLKAEGALPKAMNWIQSLRNRTRQMA